MAAITNAVLQERQEQQFKQTMGLLTQIDDRLVAMNESVREVQVDSVEYNLKIKCNEKHLEALGREMKRTRDRYVKIAMAVALLTGMGMAGANQIFSLIIP